MPTKGGSIRTRKEIKTAGALGLPSSGKISNYNFIGEKTKI